MSTISPESSEVTTKANGTVRTIGILSIVAGIILAVAGITTWVTVSSQLTAENITISEDADRFAGQQVRGPFTAFAQAEIINKHALEASGGQTYAELDREDPVRQVVMNGSFLRASLFTSVIAYGVSAMAMGLGLLFILSGVAFNSLAKPRA